MRDILFKAKRIDNGEWVEGYFAIHPKGNCSISVILDKCKNPPDGDPMWQRVLISHEVDLTTLCQYTGLTDKNGNMIWENDIVKDGVIFGTVVWDEKNAQFMIDDINDGLQEYSDWWHEVEVIGNIFDEGSELLDGN